MNECMEHIQKWYKENKRDLPWRKDKDPYHVWISEIMLQQTRIEAVKSYYVKFMKELPTISALAQVKEEKLLKLWEGLGYYHRARNLKKAAIMIEKEYHHFPNNYQELLKLPGIGEYTASAIASICFGEKQVTIDGNVLRVYARFYNDFSNIDLDSTRKKVKEFLLSILPENSGEFNESLMELGETVCLPNGMPLCQQCPLKDKCLAYQNKTYQQLPVKTPKKEKKEENYTVLLLKYQDTVAILQRKEKELLGNLFLFPMLDGKKNKEQIKAYCQKENLCYRKIKKSIERKHVFTHLQWNLSSYIIELQTLPQKENWFWEKVSTIKNEYAIPTAHQVFLKELEKENVKKV